MHDSDFFVGNFTYFTIAILTLTTFFYQLLTMKKVLNALNLNKFEDIDGKYMKSVNVYMLFINFS